MAYKPIRDTILQLFTDKSIDVHKVNYYDIDSQLPIQNHGRPDISIDAGNYTILVEVKVDENRKLEPNQPTEYIDWLNKQQSKETYFVALIPKAYKHITDLEDKVHCSEGYKTGKVNFICITWEKVITEFESREIDYLNSYVIDFLGILKKWYLTEPFTFTFGEVERMYNRETASGLKKLMLTIDKVYEKIRKGATDYEVKKRFSENLGDNGEYACYVYHQNDEILYFGLWVEYWEKEGVPFCYGVSLKSKVKNKFLKLHPKCYKFPQDKPAYYLCDIDKDTWAKAEPETEIFNLLNGLINQLK